MTRVEKRAWGATPKGDGRTSFQLWAPSEPRVLLRIAGNDAAMTKADDGWHVLDQSVSVGEHYEFVLSDGRSVPDPASRQQAGNIHGPSVVVDPMAYAWRSTGWTGRRWEEAVICEIHIGTFTEEGSFSAAAGQLLDLADLGITAFEIMPIAQFSGDRGWGYDGVLQYAPHISYGARDDLKAFVDTAHACGLMVILDVVYNHFGTEGNHLFSYAPEFFRPEGTPWGAAMAFEKRPVRDYFIENAVYWLTEFRLDGLRLDAVEQMKDDSDIHILKELSEAVRERVPGPQRHLITESPSNSLDLIDPAGGPLYEGLWNDHFHHAMHIVATGEDGGHYKPYAATPWRGVNDALARGYLAVGEGITRSAAKVSKPPPTAFVHYLQNHDQVGNRPFGERLASLIGEEDYQLWLEVLLLAPQIPLLFQGDDHRERQPFHFFVDTDLQRARQIREGRAKEARDFGDLPPGKTFADIPDANDPDTFLKNKLRRRDGEEERTFRGKLAALIAVRRDRIVPLLASIRPGTVLAERDAVVAVDWRHSDGMLQMRANFSSSAVELPLQPGEILFGHDFVVGNDIVTIEHRGLLVCNKMTPLTMRDETNGKSAGGLRRIAM